MSGNQVIAQNIQGNIILYILTVFSQYDIISYHYSNRFHLLSVQFELHIRTEKQFLNPIGYLSDSESMTVNDCIQDFAS